MSLLKLSPSVRREFDKGNPLVANTTVEAMEIEHQLSQYYKLKWGGEEPLGFHRIDIKMKEFPIIIYKEEDKLWWDNQKEEHNEEGSNVGDI